MGRPIGEAGLALIKQFEGCRLTAYKAVPTEKYWTIGWGHYGPDVEEDRTITQAEADRLLESDCQRFADAVDDPKNCPPAKELNSSQRDALISFTFNCGVGRLRTLCKNRSLPEIRDAMALYTRSGGRAGGRWGLFFPAAARVGGPHAPPPPPTGRAWTGAWSTVFSPETPEGT